MDLPFSNFHGELRKKYHLRSGLLYKRDFEAK